MSCELNLAWLLHASLVVSIHCAGVYGMVGSTSDVRNARVQTVLCQAPHLTLGSRAVPYEYNALAYICAREGWGGTSTDGHLSVRLKLLWMVIFSRTTKSMNQKGLSPQ